MGQGACDKNNASAFELHNHVGIFEVAANADTDYISRYSNAGVGHPNLQPRQSRASVLPPHILLPRSPIIPNIPHNNRSRQPASQNFVLHFGHPSKSKFTLFQSTMDLANGPEKVHCGRPLSIKTEKDAQSPSQRARSLSSTANLLLDSARSPTRSPAETHNSAQSPLKGAGDRKASADREIPSPLPQREKPRSEPTIVEGKYVCTECEIKPFDRRCEWK